MSQSNAKWKNKERFVSASYELSNIVEIYHDEGAAWVRAEIDLGNI